MQAVSLHIGLNHVSPIHYGTDQPLKNPVNDAKAMEALASAAGFGSQTLFDNEANVAAVANAVNRTSTTLVAGDIFLLTYAGHGAQMFDRTKDEPDSLDETWCLFDRMILDDELDGLYTSFAAGVRIVILSDSCYSGTIARPLTADLVDGLKSQPVYPDPVGAGPDLLLTDPYRFRSMDRSIARSTYLTNQPRYDEAKALAAATRNVDLNCSLLLLAACQDNQLASDGDTNGYFTSWLLHLWQQGQFQGSYRDLFNRLDAAMPRQQKPNLLLRGRDTDAFSDQRPFSM